MKIKILFHVLGEYDLCLKSLILKVKNRTYEVRFLLIYQNLGYYIIPPNLSE